MNSQRSAGKEKYARGRQLALALGSLGAGFLNGLLGAGGGVILYFLLGAAGKARGSKENLVLSSTAVMFFCFISLFFYKGNAALGVEAILRIGVPAALGGLCGAYLLRRLSTAAVRRLFSAVVVLGGVLMLCR